MENNANLGDITALVDAHGEVMFLRGRHFEDKKSQKAEWTEALTNSIAARQALLDAFSALQRERDRLREAVKFYATPILF